MTVHKDELTETPVAPAPSRGRVISQALVPVVGEVKKAPPFVGRSHFEELLRSKQYAEALAVLYRMRDVAPDNPSVSRGIVLLKDRLYLDFLERLGSLDGTPRLAVALDELSGDEHIVARLVDGIASLGDVFASSKLGRFETAKVLVELLDRGQLVLRTSGVQRNPTIHFAPHSNGATMDPPSFEALFERASDAYLDRRYDEALALFERCLELRPDNKRVAHNVELLNRRKSGQH